MGAGKLPNALGCLADQCKGASKLNERIRTGTVPEILEQKHSKSAKIDNNYIGAPDRDAILYHHFIFEKSMPKKQQR